MGSPGQPSAFGSGAVELRAVRGGFGLFLRCFILQPHMYAQWHMYAQPPFEIGVLASRPIPAAFGIASILSDPRLVPVPETLVENLCA